jgi:hypothetical protein
MVQALELFGVLICLFGFLPHIGWAFWRVLRKLGSVYFSLFFYFRQGCGGDVMSSVVSAG